MTTKLAPRLPAPGYPSLHPRKLGLTKLLVSTTGRIFQHPNTAHGCRTARTGCKAVGVAVLPRLRHLLSCCHVGPHPRHLAGGKSRDLGYLESLPQRGERYTQRWLPSLYIATERNGTDGDGSTKVDVTCIGNALRKGWRCEQCRSRKAHQLKRIYTKYVIRTR